MQAYARGTQSNYLPKCGLCEGLELSELHEHTYAHACVRAYVCVRTHVKGSKAPLGRVLVLTLLLPLLPQVKVWLYQNLAI
jgi:hypothetical protein